jgi:hypothetical protein
MEGVVEYLKASEADCNEDGWTSLDAAIKYVTRRKPDAVPRKYGCRTWRQLLAQLEQFEVRVDRSGDGGRGRTWYRSRVY